MILTELKRITISIPDDMDKQILELKKSDRFVRSSYSEVVRNVLIAGLKAADEKQTIE